jgi:hypothetical protein
MAQSFVQSSNQVPFDVECDEFNTACAASLVEHSRVPMVQGHISQTGEVLEFGVIHNDGGDQCVDCGLMALCDALEGVAPVLGRLKNNLFGGPSKKVRRDIWTMFKAMDLGTQVAMVFQYLGEDVSVPLSNKNLSDMKEALMTSMFFWDTLVQYVQWKFPSKVNTILWRQHDASGLVYQPIGVFDPNLPMIHIMHYTSEHYEALKPVDAKAAANAIVEAHAMEEERNRVFELLPHLYG